MLQQTFYQLIQTYTTDITRADKFWMEIKKNYSGKKRHYHNLTHLENLLIELQAAKLQIQDWDTLLFTLFYHDIIYKATRNDNEEKSAALAVDRMHELGMPNEQIEKCETQILATKKHQPGQDSDTDFFTDADLSILGKPWDSYRIYAQQVRKEYSIYPDLLYKPGRKKVLEHFLSMPRIFKTTFFYERYEKQARENLRREIVEG